VKVSVASGSTSVFSVCFLVKSTRFRVQELTLSRVVTKLDLFLKI